MDNSKNMSKKYKSDTPDYASDRSGSAHYPSADVQARWEVKEETATSPWRVRSMRG